MKATIQPVVRKEIRHKQNRQVADSLSGHLPGRANLTEFPASFSEWGPRAGRIPGPARRPLNLRGCERAGHKKVAIRGGPSRYAIWLEKVVATAPAVQLLKRLHGGLSYGHSKAPSKVRSVRDPGSSPRGAAAARPTCATSSELSAKRACWWWGGYGADRGIRSA